MQRKQIYLSILLIGIFSITNTNASSLPKSRVAEYHACTYEERNDVVDLNRWEKKWNEWADSRDDIDYNAAVLIPMYGSVNTADNLDFVIVGWSESREGMMSAKSKYAQSNLQSSFPATCTSMLTRQYSQTEPDNWQANRAELPLIYRSCKLAEGFSISDAYEKREALGVMQRKNGVKSVSRMIIPGLGRPSEEYDFILLTNHGDMENMGRNFDIWNKDETMRQEWNSIRQNAYMCENPRMYVGRRIR